mmetsp:Transcript_17983/g.67809  ORF Transcript_17983/g.67809 Transcript_17983/m.67809 type:complete len:214 (+) Transcript_17983:4926-5567(+)
MQGMPRRSCVRSCSWRAGNSVRQNNPPKTPRGGGTRPRRKLLQRRPEQPRQRRPRQRLQAGWRQSTRPPWRRPACGPDELPRMRRPRFALPNRRGPRGRLLMLSSACLMSAQPWRRFERSLRPRLQSCGPQRSSTAQQPPAPAKRRRFRGEARSRPRPELQPRRLAAGGPRRRQSSLARTPPLRRRRRWRLPPRPRASGCRRLGQCCRTPLAE